MTLIIKQPKALKYLVPQIEKMKIILFLIIISLLVAGGFLVAFLWAVGSGQYDDDYTPSVRMLFEDEKISDNK